MTINEYLDAIKEFTENAVKDYILPVRIQSANEEQNYRAAEVYKMRLPDSTAAKKKAPYIILQVITSSDHNDGRGQMSRKITLRAIFCVYSDDEQEGALMLLELMERWRIAILRKQVIGKQFTLDIEEGIDSVIYPDDTAPYYAGEASSVWNAPTVEREVNFLDERYQS